MDTISKCLLIPRKITCHEQINSNRSKYYVPTTSYISGTLFLKAFRFNLKVWVKFSKKLALSSEKLNFRKYGSSKYTQTKFQRIVIRCHLIRDTLLQLSCGNTCYYSCKTIKCHLLVLKVNIFNSDKAERYDGQRKHQGRFRLSTGINAHRHYLGKLSNQAANGLNFVHSNIIHHLRL